MNRGDKVIRTETMLQKCKIVLERLEVYSEYKGINLLIHRYIAIAYSKANNLNYIELQNFELVYNWAYLMKPDKLKSLLPKPLYIDDKMKQILFCNDISISQINELKELGFYYSEIHGPISILYDFLTEIRYINEKAYMNILVDKNTIKEKLNKMILFYKKYYQINFIESIK